MPDADIGVVGLAVMGQSLALNMNDHGFRVAVFNRTTAKVDAFLAGPAAGTRIVGHHALPHLVATLARPRRILMMVRAGSAVDDLIGEITPLLDAGDCLIDGGNSHFRDTERRTRALAARGIHYVGAGISGGEDGARHGPSIMPGGDPLAWPLIRELFQGIAARVDGVPCCDWIGEGGAGHYVKMVHNGIEYGDMQLIAEAYLLLRAGLGLTVDEVQAVFADWDKGVLSSYLIEITAQILAVRDDDGAPLIDKVLDRADQKGTGSWTAIEALELGVPAPLIGEAVFARSLSAMKDERIRASTCLPAGPLTFGIEPQRFIERIHDALYAAKICSYAQGFLLLREAANNYGWQLDLGGIALMWRGGCIIRSRFLDDIKAAYDETPEPESLLQQEFFRDELARTLPRWRKTVAMAVGLGLPVPALTSALAFYDGYRRADLSANLIQAQRDHFGAHTYERTDRPRGEAFHTDWGRGRQGGDLG
ncbi:decarboxylating NADP(+)-dependent phosphogluconate dehydrogenase [Thiococcus pfennigii]|jgi:6-phosphogluconate dehydrogenase|uniref:decarboxylating NADP(+)-dependent phosphogluconate dehydrogenase n=1 Tax=Thiococcus pfennigii TaxID=1057 RepID=UPI001905F089|nr:decarboxylating NADP(+)-dependent phosphogluconate dehydrogenase [Thiococcus pfennigii]MBK1730298.1 phosphogluconate dehydrogenase (NADP(+)-dependent, decarboxylating) [Thiococcus pfennigii]